MSLSSIKRTEENAVAQGGGTDPTAEIAVITDCRGFDALEAEWSDLHERADTTVFQSYPWVRTWWRHFGEDFPRRLLHLVTVRKEGCLVAIAPFYIDVTRLNALASTRVLRFVGTGISDCLDMMVQPGCEQTAVKALGTHLARLARTLDAIELSEIRDASCLRLQLGDELAAAGVKTVTEICDNCPRLTLASDWEQTLAGASGDFRRKLRARERRLYEHAPIGFETIGPGEVLDPAMDDFVAMHEERLADKVGRGIYTDPRMEKFHREACARFHAKGWLFLTFMTMHGKRVFANCYYFHKNHIYCHLGGATDVGEAWNHSPGIVLESHCIQQALQRGGRVYDFLRGTEPYKYRFGAVDVPLWSITMQRTRFETAVLGRIGACGSVAKRLIRKMLLRFLVAPVSLITMLREWISGKPRSIGHGPMTGRSSCFA